MTKIIYPMLKDGYVSPRLQQETAERTIPLLPIEGERLHWYQSIWLNVRVIIKKLLNYGK